jgi:cell division protein ZapE
MNGPTPADATGGVAHLVDRRPTVSPERLIAQLTPPPTFAEARFARYHHDPAGPTQSPAVAAWQQICPPPVAP